MSRAKMSGLIAFVLMASLGAGSALAGTIKGTVNGPDGKAVAGAKVRLMAAGAEGGKKPEAKAKLAAGEKPEKGKKGGAGGTPVAEAETDASGMFKFENVADGSYTVMAMVKGVGAGKEAVTVSGTGEATVTVTLKERKAK